MTAALVQRSYPSFMPSFGMMMNGNNNNNNNRQQQQQQQSAAAAATAAPSQPPARRQGRRFSQSLMMRAAKAREEAQKDDYSDAEDSHRVTRSSLQYRASQVPATLLAACNSSLSISDSSSELFGTTAGLHNSTSSSCSASCSNEEMQKKPRRRRVVRFQLDEHNRIQTDVYHYPKARSDRICWNGAQLHGMQKHVKQIAQEYASQPQYERCIRALFTTNTSCASEQEEMEAVRILSESGSRGMERRISKLLRTHRRQTIQQIVALQDHLVMNEPIMCEEDRQLAIRTCYHQMSQRATAFAIKMAQGDARQAGIIV